VLLVRARRVCPAHPQSSIYPTGKSSKDRTWMSWCGRIHRLSRGRDGSDSLQSLPTELLKLAAHLAHQKQRFPRKFGEWDANVDGRRYSGGYSRSNTRTYLNCTCSRTSLEQQMSFLGFSGSESRLVRAYIALYPSLWLSSNVHRRPGSRVENAGGIARKTEFQAGRDAAKEECARAMLHTPSPQSLSSVVAPRICINLQTKEMQNLSAWRDPQLTCKHGIFSFIVVEKENNKQRLVRADQAEHTHQFGSLLASRIIGPLPA
jgi:hypothetical protein